MIWLFVALAIFAYIIIGQFVAGILDPDDIGQILAFTILWPAIVVIFLLMYPTAYLRKLGRRFGKWLDDHDIFD